MPPDNDTPKAAAPTNTGTPVPPMPEIFTFKDFKLFDGTFSGSVTQPQPNQYQSQAGYLFGNGDTIGANVLLGTQPLSFDKYGLNGQFGIGNGGVGKLNFEALPPLSTYSFNTDFKFGNGNTLITDLTSSPAGLNVGANGTYGIGNGGTGTSALRFDGPNQTFSTNTGLVFGNGNTFNTDLTNSPAGLNIGANGTYGIGNGGTGTSAARIDGPNQTFSTSTGLVFGNGNTFNTDLTNSLAGLNIGASGTYGIANGGTGTSAVRIDGPNQTFSTNTGLVFGNGNTFKTDLTNTPAGLNIGASGTYGIGNGGTGTSVLRIDGPNQTFSANTGLTFGNGNTFSADVTKSPSGSIYGANGTFGIGNGTGLAGFRINEIESTSAYNLGVQFGKNQYSLNHGASPEGNTFGAGAQLGFANDKGMVNLNGTFGPKLSELTGGVTFKDKDFEYSGNVKLNNEAGSFGLAEIGGKLSKGNDREKFSIEGNYKPQNNEYSVMLSYTLNFGGSRNRNAAPTTQEFSQQMDTEVASFKDKQAIARLDPHDKKLYEQAVAGVEKLNADGANLPLRETAASLAALANQRGIAKIDEVSLGNPTADGKRNLFIFEGSPSSQGNKPPVFMDSAQAAATPVQSSTQILQRTSNPPETQTAAQDNPQLAIPKLAAR